MPATPLRVNIGSLLVIRRTQELGGLEVAARQAASFFIIFNDIGRRTL